MPVGRTALLKSIQRIRETDSSGPFAIATTCDDPPNPGLHFQHFGFLGIPVAPPEVERLLATLASDLPTAPSLGPVRNNARRGGPQKEDSFGCTPEARSKRFTAKTTPEKPVPVVGHAQAAGDTRSSFEIPAADISQRNPKWDKWVRKAAQHAGTELGICDVGGVVPRLNRLQLCRPGRCVNWGGRLDQGDVFASMIVVLSSSFKASDSVVEHNGQTVTLGMCHTFPGFNSTAVVAWYSGLSCTMGEVTEGVRMCLVYDLAYEGSKSMPKPPTDVLCSPAVQALRKILASWSKESNKQRTYFVWLFGHQPTKEALENYATNWCDAVVESALKLATADISIGLEAVTVNTRMLSSKILGRIYLEKHDVIQSVDFATLGSDSKGLLLYSASFSDVLAQMRKNGRSNDERFAYFKDNVTASLSNTEATELAEIIAALRSNEYDSTVIDFIACCPAIQNKVELAQNYLLHGPCVRLLQFLSTSDNSLARTSEGQEIETILHVQGTTQVNSLPFWTDQMQWHQSCLETNLQAFRRLVSEDVQETFVQDLVNDKSAIRSRLSAPSAIDIFRQLKRVTEALKVVLSLFRSSFDLTDEGAPMCYNYSGQVDGKNKLLFGVLQDMVLQADLSTGSKRKAETMGNDSIKRSTMEDLRNTEDIKKLNAHLIKLDDRAGRSAPPALRSAYCGMWGNHSLEAAPRTDRLLVFFKAIPECHRPIFVEVARYLFDEYAGLCDKPAALPRSDYAQYATRTSNPQLQQFFMDPHQEEVRISGTKDQRKHLHRLLEGMDVTHTSTDYGSRGATLVIRKRHTRVSAEKEAQVHSKNTLQWLSAEVKRIEAVGAETTASLGKEDQSKRVKQSHE